MKMWHFLKVHYQTTLDQSFKQFRLGAMVFFLGMVIIYIANQLWKPSLSQEIMTLIGLALVIAGFILAIVAQIRFLIGRILTFFSHK